jgi:hypothetical protein
LAHPVAPGAACSTASARVDVVPPLLVAGSGGTISVVLAESAFRWHGGEWARAE